ncbi:MAG: hypothetical protein LBP75_07430 [Planctomycetota bacterium]|nr:hypothetical protein [Planctomycetota bacterium]
MTTTKKNRAASENKTPAATDKKRSRWEDFLKKNPDFQGGAIIDMKTVLK